METLETARPSLLDHSFKDPAPTVTQRSESNMHIEKKKEEPAKKEETKEGNNREERDLSLPKLIDSDEEGGSEDESEHKYSQRHTSKSIKGSTTATSSRKEDINANHERNKAGEI